MHRLQAAGGDAGKRLDQFLQDKLPDYSRSRLQHWIKTGRVWVNGRTAKPSLEVRGGEKIEVEPAAAPSLKAFAEDLPVKILYEDADVIAVDKPAGMVVHAGAGNTAGTLVNALLHRFGQLPATAGADRPGIVHRLDRQTSGVLLVARTEAAHRALARQFASREVEKTYLALVHGVVRKDQGEVDAPISRDQLLRTRMTARGGRGRAALTRYRVLRRGEKFTYLEVRIHTGRTHQIRVHMASIGHPVAGDRMYGGKRIEGAPAERYFLHAHRIVFTSPRSGERVTVESPIPEDLEGLLEGPL